MNLNYENILSQLGIDYKDKGNYLSACCPNPSHQDNNPSWVLWKESGYHRCFSCGFKGNIKTLIKNLSGKNIYEFLDIKDKFGFQYKKIKTNKKIKSLDDITIDIQGNFSEVSSNIEVLRYLENRHIGYDFIKTFDIKYLHYAVINEKKWYKRICIPIYYQGKLINIEGRALEKNSIPKVLYVQGGSSNILFNYDNLNFNEPLYVVEGLMDTVQIWNKISKNVTCTFGSQLTKNQLTQLNKFSIIVLIPDNDEAGLKMISQLEKDLEDKEFYIVMLPESNDKIDPGNCNFEVLKDCIGNKVLSVDYFLNKSGLIDNTNYNIGWK